MFLRQCLYPSIDNVQILEAYETQLRHLHKELQLVQTEYEDWQQFSQGKDTAGHRRR